jgi:WxcM-like, C-terminal
MTHNVPSLIYFPSAGSTDIGFITIAELSSLLPFKVERVFWTYDTPLKVVRGRHAHKITEQVLIALSGKITIITETAQGETLTHVLNNPNIGLYLPPNVWHTMKYSKGAIQLVLASTGYHESDYFRNKKDFVDYWGGAFSEQ